MSKDPSQKYRPFPVISLPDRTWPSKTITEVPIWCGSDLCDDDQSLIEPVNATKKTRFFKTLVQVGLKQIGIASPLASNTDFNSARELIEGNYIPNDITAQVLTQTREGLITRTFKSLRGTKKAIVHVYSATAPLFRRIVFNQDKRGAVDIATNAAKLIKKLAVEQPDTQWSFQYSPEVFSSTELEFSVEVCNTVIDVRQPIPSNGVILNPPATVECTIPNVCAGQIERFGRHADKRDSVIISLHTHNDRGTDVAATELGPMVGADHVEGHLLSNGERIGGVDPVTLVLSMYTQGPHPQLDFSGIDTVHKMVRECNQLPVHLHHSYVGNLIHTALSGPHQNVIRKGFTQQKENAIWEVPYLLVDPTDIGHGREAVIRANSQSSKGGITFLLEQEYGVSLP